MEPHPVFHADLARGPEGGRAWRVAASDGTGLRVGTWAAGARGTVLVFPGRNEHVEKYGRVAGDLAARGWSTAAIDWRGQGHSDRAPGAGVLGHVARFTDYQKDAAAYLETVRGAGLPEPFFLIGHSMGGAIGVRALAEGFPVAAAAFTAPMWGIRMTAYLRPVAYGISAVARTTGFGLREVPAGSRGSYLAVTPFAENVLTSDEETYDWMVAQALHDTRFALGRPTLTWLHESLVEMRRLRALPLPALPAHLAIAGAEAIVDNDAIATFAATWPTLETETYEGAKHEIMMERPEHRTRFLNRIDALFGAAARDAA